ncbi:hypothetical protein L9F63_017400, partial [Diploptera punctata]
STPGSRRPCPFVSFRSHSPRRGETSSTFAIKCDDLAILHYMKTQHKYVRCKPFRACWRMCMLRRQNKTTQTGNN